MTDATAPVCAEHVDRPALGACARCGTYLCGTCGYAVGVQVLCIRCHARSPSGKERQLRTAGGLRVANSVFMLAGGVVMFVLVWYLRATPQEARTFHPAGASGHDDPTTVIVFGVAGAIYVAVAAIQATGGILLWRRRARKLALFAVVTTMFTAIVSGLPGLVSLGIGIWALSLLLDRRVAAEFDRPRNTPSGLARS